MFASLFHTISPQAYRFVRESNTILNLPHPNTIQNLCGSYNVDPHNEQISSSFFFFYYIKRKFSALNNQDKLIIIVVHEIHLKEFME